MLNCTGLFAPLINNLSASIPNKRKVDNSKSHAMRGFNFHERYRLAFNGEDKTCAQISGALGLTHTGCNMSLFRLEEQGYIKRVGKLQKTHRMGQPAIVWRWIGKEEKC